MAVMLTTTASVPLMLNPMLMLRPIPHTCMLPSTAQLLPHPQSQLPPPALLIAPTFSTNVRPKLSPRLMPMPPPTTMVDTTVTPDTTDMAADTTVDITDILMA